MVIIKKETMEVLSKELSLPFTGNEQDWNIEMADSSRVNEFIDFYNHFNLSEDEKVAVISLILASYDDFLNESDLNCDDSWVEIKSIIESEKVFFADVIDYWSLSNENGEENLFRITPLVRAIECC